MSVALLCPLHRTAHASSPPSYTGSVFHVCLPTKQAQHEAGTVSTYRCILGPMVDSQGLSSTACPMRGEVAICPAPILCQPLSYSSSLPITAPRRDPQSCLCHAAEHQLGGRSHLPNVTHVVRAQVRLEARPGGFPPLVPSPSPRTALTFGFHPRGTVVMPSMRLCSILGAFPRLPGDSSPGISTGSY